MNAYRAVKSDFVPSSETMIFRDRETAISGILENGEEAAVHEHAPDPMIYHAASELIRMDDEGHKTDIEAQGKPYDVLTQVADELMESGASRFATRKIFETLENYITGLGADFARQAKAKPLYARVMVTDKEPQDIPDCVLTSVTCIDGTRVQGSDASRVVLQNTIYGTRMSQSNAMSMEKVFESGKQKWLLIYYGTIESSDLNSFDTVDADMTALVQAVGPAAASSVAGGEIREAIQKGNVTPAMTDLIRNVAELNRVTEAARTPGAVENAAAKITELKAAITQLTQTVSKFETIPPVIAAATVTAMAQEVPAVSVQTPVVNAQALQDIVASIVADNDNKAVPVLEQSAAVIEPVKLLLENKDLPIEVKQVLASAIESVSKAVETRDVKEAAQNITQLRETLENIVKTNAAVPQIVETIANITPSIVTAEKQVIAVLPETRAEKIMQAIEAVESKIQSGAIDKKDPAMAEIVKSVAEIKEVLKSENRDVAIQKIVEMIEAKPQAAALSVAVATMVQKMAEPAVAEKLPPEIKQEIAKAVVEIKNAVQPPELPKAEVLSAKIDVPVKPDIKTAETKVDAKAEIKADVKTDVKADVKPEAPVPVKTPSDVKPVAAVVETSAVKLSSFFQKEEPAASPTAKQAAPIVTTHVPSAPVTPPPAETKIPSTPFVAPTNTGTPTAPPVHRAPEGTPITPPPTEQPSRVGPPRNDVAPPPPPPKPTQPAQPPKPEKEIIRSQLSQPSQSKPGDPPPAPATNPKEKEKPQESSPKNNKGDSTVTHENRNKPAETVTDRKPDAVKKENPTSSPDSDGKKIDDRRVPVAKPAELPVFAIKNQEAFVQKLQAFKPENPVEFNRAFKEFETKMQTGSLKQEDIEKFVRQVPQKDQALIITEINKHIEFQKPDLIDWQKDVKVFAPPPPPPPPEDKKTCGGPCGSCRLCFTGAAAKGGAAPKSSKAGLTQPDSKSPTSKPSYTYT